MSIALIANELANISQLAGITPFGQRSTDVLGQPGSCPNTSDSFAMGTYTPLQQARFLAEDGTRLIKGFPAEKIVGNKDEMLAQLAAYSGYATLLLGEGFCEMALDGGPLMTRQQVFQRAEASFTAAITHADLAAKPDLRQLALAGRARTRLDLGNPSGAAADAEAVSAGYVWNATYSTINPLRENRIFNLNRRNNFIGVDPAAYGNVLLAG
ncbi:MAG: hypothetical protein ACREMA_02885, partial [Longimicrobiales bacterium]